MRFQIAADCQMLCADIVLLCRDAKKNTIYYSICSAAVIYIQTKGELGEHFQQEN